MTSVMDVESFAKWGDTEPDVDPDEADEAMEERGDAPSRFPVDAIINTKLSLG